MSKFVKLLSRSENISPISPVPFFASSLGAAKRLKFPLRACRAVSASKRCEDGTPFAYQAVTDFVTQKNPNV
jgi:hypothetical protein